MNELILESEDASIIKSIKSVHDKNEPCQVWQSIDGKRELFNCLISSISSDSSAITVEAIEGEKCFNFNSDGVVYCRFSSRGLLFKTNIKSKSSFSVSISIPSEIIIEESRGKERSTFGNYSSFHCDISFSEKSLMKNCYKIFDLSPNGICLLVNDTEKEYFSTAKELFMSSIQGIKPTNKTSCKVCHIKESSLGKDSKKYKVGIEFEPKLNEEDYLKVIEAII